jgi:Raf kinase inhibitor-like YbhB/YbcL family protein
MNITSPAFADGTPVPAEHTCEGSGSSPGLAWSEIPVNTRSFALICDDPDAPRGTWVHWVLFNLPADAVELAPAVPPAPELPSGARQGINDSGDVGYGGPCPPRSQSHRYFFRLYALDCTLNLAPGVKRPELDHAMAGHVLADATLMGTFQR